MLPSSLVLPAASGVAAKPPTAAKPLSLARRLRFEGFAWSVADPDMILEGGE